MINILIVEDEPLLRTSVQTLTDWEKEGFSFVGAVSNGEEGLAFLEEHGETDIVLLDILMPVMDGITMMEQLRKKGGSPAVIILSANNQFDLVREAFKLGALDYILKSEMDEATLLEHLRNASEKMGERLSGDRIFRSESEHIVSSLLEDCLLGKMGELNCRLMADLGFSLPFPCRMGMFELDEGDAGNQVKSIIALRGEELLKNRGRGCFAFLPGNRGVVFLEPEMADSFGRDFSEIVRDTMNITLSFHFGDVCENVADLPGEYEYLLALDRGQSRIVRKAKSYVRKNFARDDISLEEVSRHVDVSKSHLSAQFKKESGTTFREYLTQVRMDAAKIMLEETNLRVYEIGEAVGYPNVEHFSRLFKKNEGVSPNRYHK